MATRTFSAPVVEFYGESITADATTLKVLGVPISADELMLYCSSKETRVQTSPVISQCLVTADSGVTFSNYTQQTKDRDTGTVVVLDSLDTAANGDYFYLAAINKFAGAWLDIGAANGTVSTLSGYYWNGTAWADASITDGTKSGTTTLAQDGNITWTPASAWAKTTLNGMSGLYVIRFQVSVQLDDEVEVDQIFLLPDVTTNPGGYFNAATDYIMTIDRVRVGAVAIYQGAGDAGVVHYTWMRHARKE
jgi:hypothetical protein